MIQAAGIYLKMNAIDRPARFDVVALVWNSQGMNIDHIEDAFLPFL